MKSVTRTKKYMHCIVELLSINSVHFLSVEECKWIKKVALNIHVTGLLITS